LAQVTALHLDVNVDLVDRLMVKILEIVMLSISWKTFKPQVPGVIPMFFCSLNCIQFVCFRKNAAEVSTKIENCRIHTVDGSEIPWPTTVWMMLKPVVNNGIRYLHLNW